MKLTRNLPLIILLVLIAIAGWGVGAMGQDQIIIVVHTGESKTFHYNPATHGELRQEMADGGMMLSVVPKEVLEERRRILDELKRPR